MAKCPDNPMESTSPAPTTKCGKPPIGPLAAGMTLRACVDGKMENVIYEPVVDTNTTYVFTAAPPAANGDTVITITDSDGGVQTITIPNPPETDGVHFSGTPTIDAAGLVTFATVNDIDESAGAPVLLDLGALISSDHPTFVLDPADGTAVYDAAANTWTINTTPHTVDTSSSTVVTQVGSVTTITETPADGSAPVVVTLSNPVTTTQTNADGTTSYLVDGVVIGTTTTHEETTYAQTTDADGVVTTTITAIPAGGGTPIVTTITSGSSTLLVDGGSNLVDNTNPATPVIQRLIDGCGDIINATTHRLQRALSDSCGACLPAGKRVLTIDDIRPLEPSVNVGGTGFLNRTQMITAGVLAPTAGYVVVDRDESVLTIENPHDCLDLKCLVVFGGRMGIDSGDAVNEAQNLTANVEIAQRLYLNGVNTRDIVLTSHNANNTSNIYYSQQGFETIIIPAGQQLVIDRETRIFNGNQEGEDPFGYVWNNPAIRVFSSYV